MVGRDPFADVVATAPEQKASRIDSNDEKPGSTSGNAALADDSANQKFEETLNATEDDLLEAKELAATFSLEQLRQMMTQVHTLHRSDPNFPLSIILRIEEFLHNEAVFEHPEKHEHLIAEMKIEAALITNNSPYSEVRSVVDNHDDPTMPCSTIRAWCIGVVFSAAIAFINAFFEIRMPLIYLTSNVPQLLAYPVGKLMEKTLPDVGITLFGVRHSLNPGPFNRKEHMMITIMASIAKGTPYTNYIIWMQYLPQYFNMPWAINFGYQMLLALSTNFIGFGLAGLCRRFLVYPSFCVWPASLVTIALNNAFHSEGNPAVPGPLGSIWKASRLKFFCIAMGGMFVYFWFPNYIFTALAMFSWMTWISPNNVNLNIITGSERGLGFNPFPTFDWNRMLMWGDPLMVPFFTTFNMFLGAMIAFITIVGMIYTNAFYTSHFPPISNTPYDNMGLPYNISLITDERGLRVDEMYDAYSPPYLSAGAISMYMWFFAAYTAAMTYGFMYHWHELKMGFRDLVNSFRPSKREQVEKDRVLDVHNRLMKAYPEVPEWWYFICLAIATVLGCVAISQWPTQTSPGVVFFGIAIAFIFVIPIGIIMAMTGTEVSLNVLSEFLGGAWVEGNALSMCFFKTYGYITTHQALYFSNDLKIAHYLKIPPRMTFCAQMVPTLVSTFVCVAVLQYQINLPNICTPEAPFRFYCPGVASYFTAAVLWGTVGPKKLWGVGGLYAPTLVGFPVGVAAVLIVYFLQKRFPKSAAIRNIHPVVMVIGGYTITPYNLTYTWPPVPVAAMSWLYIKSRFLGLWSKYNFILSAAFSTGIALSGLVQFFSLAYNNIEINWWGNTVTQQGCELEPCTLKTVDYLNGEIFGPGPGQF